MDMEKLNYEFKIRDIEKTKQKHNAKIEKAKEIKYSEIIDSDFEDAILTKTTNSGNYTYYLEKEIKENPNQRNLNQLKTLVNGITREILRNSLEYAGYPTSWDTAFYLLHKKKIDAIMKRTAKTLMKYALN